MGFLDYIKEKITASTDKKQQENVENVVQNLTKYYYTFENGKFVESLNPRQTTQTNANTKKSSFFAYLDALQTSCNTKKAETTAETAQINCKKLLDQIENTASALLKNNERKFPNFFSIDKDLQFYIKPEYVNIPLILILLETRKEVSNTGKIVEKQREVEHRLKILKDLFISNPVSYINVLKYFEGKGGTSQFDIGQNHYEFDIEEDDDPFSDGGRSLSKSQHAKARKGSYESMTVIELKKRCAKRGIKGYSLMRKVDLIKALRNR